MRYLLFILLFSALCHPDAPARQQAGSDGNGNGHGTNIMTVPRMTGTVTLDGTVDEAVWEGIAPLSLTMKEPVYQGELSERTEIRVAHDGRYLYVAGRLFDSDPEGIRANSLARDRYSGDDCLGIVLDTFNDNENGRWFVTLPTGVRLDMEVTNDAEFNGSGPPVNDSWNGFWEAATSRDERGWYAEMRIPFSTLGFQDHDGRVVMGLIAYRYIARKNEMQIFPAISQEWGMGHIKPSLAHRIELEQVTGRRPLYITPYLLGGLSREIPRQGSTAPVGRVTQRQAGLDIRSNLTGNLTLNLTFNTDFAQVEADDEMVNLSRFSLFMPEKRQFFQERAGIFDFGTVFMGRLFYSRRIGLNFDGEPVRILGGGRLVGRIGNWDIGVIDMQTDEAPSRGAENLGVIRLRRQVFNAYSWAGGMVTHRLGADGSRNLAYGLDSMIRVGGDDYLTVKWSQTFDDDLMSEGRTGSIESGFFMAEWQRRRLRGLNGFATAAWCGPDWMPGLGFSTRSDFVFVRTRLAYSLPGRDDSAIRMIEPGVFLNGFVRNADGALESNLIQVMNPVQFRSGLMVMLGAYSEYEEIPETFSLSETAEVPAGRYRSSAFFCFFEMPESALFRFFGEVRGGGFYDGRIAAGRATLTWRASRHLELVAEYNANLIRFHGRDQAFDSHLARLRLRGAVNTHLSANTFLQYNSATEIVSLNGQVRWHLSEGRDLWLVINDCRTIDPLVPLESDGQYCAQRTIMMKYTYTFIR